MSDYEVAVVGGGLGGLAAGLSLHRAGCAVVVIEAEAGPVKDRWGLTLWPPAFRELTALGLGDVLREHGNVIGESRMNRPSGEKWVSIPLPNGGPIGRFVGSRPSVMVGALRELTTAAGVPVLRGYRVAKLEREPGGVRLHLTGPQPKELHVELVVGCDGPGSTVRKLVGLPFEEMRIPGQSILTGIGGAVSFTHMQQALGEKWCVSTVPTGDGTSWLAVIAHGQDPHALLRSYAARDPGIAQAVADFDGGSILTPASLRVPRWETDRVVLMGDAAHGMLPHLGLGGSQTLEDVPFLVSIVTDALRRGDLSESSLRAFRKERAGRVSHARRVSEMWASTCTGPSTMVRLFRDMNVSRLARRPDVMASYMTQLAGDKVPSLGTRLAVGLI